MLENRGDLRVEERRFTAVITLNRPEKRNAMNLFMICGLIEFAETLALRTDLKAVVLTGGPEYFTAGMDLSDMVSLDLPNTPLVEKRKLLGYAPAMCRAWEKVPRVTVAPIEGFSLGGGVNLASAPDSLGSHMDRDQFLLTVTDPESMQRMMSLDFEGLGDFGRLGDADFLCYV